MARVVAAVLVVAAGMVSGCGPRGMGPAAPPPVWQEQFNRVSGWSVLPAGAQVGSDGSGLIVRDWGQAQRIVLEKPLPFPLPPGQTFSLAARLVTDDDPAGRAGGVAVALLDEQDRVIGQITWHDDQPGAGYGSADIVAEDNWPIYRTDPSGLGREFNTFNGNFVLSRRGNQWQALAEGKALGKPLELEPTLWPAKIRITATRLPGVPARAWRIEQIRLYVPR